MIEDNKLSKPLQWQPMSLHEWVSIFCGIFQFACTWTVIIICFNWLVDFLHAPIGIKDNPPEPGVIVQFAHMAILPVAGCYCALRLLKYFSGIYSPKEVLQGLAGALLWIVGVVFLAGELMHRDFIPGTRYIFRVLAPIGFVLLLLVVDGFIAYACWKDADSHKSKLAAAAFTASTLSGIAALIEFCISSKQYLELSIAMTIFLFLGGFWVAPNVRQSAPDATDK